MGPQLDAALDCARRGWPVFPLHGVRVDGEETSCTCDDGPKCKHKGRHPRHDDYLKRATSDETAILGYWTTWPDAPIGLPTGAASRIVALEINIGQGGDQAFLAAVEEHGSFPDVPRIDTTDGILFLFSAPQEPIPKRAKVDHGLYVRGDGSFVVLPPYRSADGAPCEWPTSADPDALAPAPLPPWMLHKAMGRAPTPPEPMTAQRAEPARAEVASAPEGPRIQWLDTPDIFAPLPPIKWICEKMQWAPGRPPLLAAYGASGKTMIMQDALVSLAAGRPLWDAVDFTVPGPLRVGHLDYDQGAWATRRRYQRLCAGKGIDPRDIAYRLRVSSLARIPLTHAKAVDIFCRALDGLDFVLIDALRGLIAGVDENDSRVRDEIDKLTLISEKTGAAIVLIHHQGKPRDNDNGDARLGLRGSSGIFDACGSVFTLQSKPDEPARRLVHVKPAAESTGGLIEPFYLQFEDVAIGNDPKGGVRVVYRSAEQDQKQKQKHDPKLERLMRKVLAFVKDHDGCSARTLVAGVEGSSEKVYGARDELRRREYLRVDRPNEKNKPVCHYITPAGLAWLAGEAPPATPGPADAPEREPM
ncbi:bifunctional DNA primase/polymerase [Polyangium jinanense]|uniref:Bifunctional DNA primase/polymerase n=1 Tax=Polyangium jinanense TaxID=2829994 RepID=A0A9X4AZH2_9BACT|nr:bifunctional DNA primase/polymerase [Polyangium jinanense]MDC3961796.1 bifunctional DNA primase/polymerase [Polyangium jinanense]MDC3988310.1 bifunctional DNA primase/polymerase [Polyangium jinanense]